MGRKLTKEELEKHKKDALNKVEKVSRFVN